MADRSVPGVRKIRRGEANPHRAFRAGTRRSRTGRSYSGEGYSTDRSYFRTHFEVSIEHGNWGNTVASAKRIIDSNLGNVEKFFKSLERDRADVPTGNFAASLTMGQRRDAGRQTVESATIDPFLALQHFPANAAREVLNDIGRIGISEIQHGIRNPENRPRSPRYDTGFMYNSVDQRIRYSQAKTTVQIGWNRTFRKYFGFQEMGTFSIGPMNAITSGYRRTVPKAYSLMSRYFANYSKKTGFSGRYTK